MSSIGRSYWATADCASRDCHDGDVAGLEHRHELLSDTSPEELTVTVRRRRTGTAQRAEKVSARQ